MEEMRRMMMMQQAGMGGGREVIVADTAETVHISSLALLKMLKHGVCAGVGFLGCLAALVCVRGGGATVVVRDTRVAVPLRVLLACG